MIFGVVFLGLFAGLTGGIMALGWIWPNYGGGDTWIVSQTRIDTSRVSLEEIVRKESADKIFAVYSNYSTLEGMNYLADEHKISDAVVVGSDGWLAMRLQQKPPVFYSARWRAISSGGTIYKVEKHLFDPYAKVSYIKISLLENGTEGPGQAMAQFKVANFEDTTGPFDEVFVFEKGEWRYSRVGYTTMIESPVSGRLDSAPWRLYGLDGNYSDGSIVINRKGRVVGFVSGANRFAPSSYLSGILSSVLSKEKIEYPSFGVMGWFSVEQPVYDKKGQAQGFAVAGIWNKNSKLRKGDVIIEINGQIVRDEKLWYNIGAEEVKLTVLRSGKIIELTNAVFYADPESVKN
jgi:hypothetical protein